MNQAALPVGHGAQKLDAKRLDDLIVMFETLRPESLAALDAFYAPMATFRDPFNDLVGRPAIHALFAHMFETLEDPRFVVHERMVEGVQVFLTWRFYFKIKGFKNNQAQTIDGSTFLRGFISEDGVWMIDLHRDYWDVAQELYEKLPLIGNVLRFLRKKLACPRVHR